jgi:CelD/BcsL family acetyltransferase involved in cellulose biosynthesis
VSRARLIERPEELEQHLAGWDALAVAARQPLGAPGWLLPWWRHAAPSGALLRTLVLEDEQGSLAGIAPFYAQPGQAGRWDYRLLGAPLTQRREPLARPGLEDALAAETARMIARGEPLPAVVALEAIAEHSPWPGLLARNWPRAPRPRVIRRTVQPAPVVTLPAGGFESWLESRSSNFRQQLRRARRQLADAGGRMRLSDAATIEADVHAFLELHHARWEERGGSGLPDRMAELVVESALMLGERLRLWMVELEDRPIGAGLFVAAGGEIAYVNGGFDEEHARLRPSLLAIAAAVEEGFERGEVRLDLGGGANPYKQRFADSDDPIAWMSLRPRNRRYPLTQAQLLGGDLRWWAAAAARRLPEDKRDRLRALLRG